MKALALSAAAAALALAGFASAAIDIVTETFDGGVATDTATATWTGDWIPGANAAATALFGDTGYVMNGNAGEPFSKSALFLTVDMGTQSGFLTFDYVVGGEALSDGELFDYMDVLLDGVPIDGLTGLTGPAAVGDEVPTWYSSDPIPIGPGTHTIEWSYIKDSVFDNALFDGAGIDNVLITKVPGPGALSLFGVVVLTGRRRRRT